MKLFKGHGIIIICGLREGSSKNETFKMPFPVLMLKHI